MHLVTQQREVLLLSPAFDGERHGRAGGAAQPTEDFFAIEVLRDFFADAHDAVTGDDAGEFGRATEYGLDDDRPPVADVDLQTDAREGPRHLLVQPADPLFGEEGRERIVQLVQQPRHRLGVDGIGRQRVDVSLRDGCRDLVEEARPTERCTRRLHGGGQVSACPPAADAQQSAERNGSGQGTGSSWRTRRIGKNFRHRS